MKLLNKLILISDQKGFQNWHTTKEDSSVLTDWKLREHHSLAQPNLKMLRTLTLAYNWTKLTQNLFSNKVLHISLNLSNAVLKVKNRILIVIFRSLSSKESTCNAGDRGSIPGLGRSPGEGKGYSLRYSCLENPTDRGAWQASVHGDAKASKMTWRLNTTTTIQNSFT